MNQYKNKKVSTYTILKNFWKVILEEILPLLLDNLKKED